MLHGAQRDLFDLSFCLPSECARRLAAGEAALGIVPAIEMARQGMAMVPGTGIACRGAVRSILLVSKVPFTRVRTLAADSGSRTSVELARIILAERYGTMPEITRMTPELDSMLEEADAALVIGDPALRIEPSALSYHAIDLGEEWWTLTGLPMVFAVWAGRGPLDAFRAEDFTASYRFGAEHVREIVSAEYQRRGVSAELALRYLTENIVFELGDEEYRGLERYLELAGRLTARSLIQSGREVTV